MPNSLKIKGKPNNSTFTFTSDSRNELSLPEIYINDGLYSFKNKPCVSARELFAKLKLPESEFISFCVNEFTDNDDYAEGKDYKYVNHGKDIIKGEYNSCQMTICDYSLTVSLAKKLIKKHTINLTPQIMTAELQIFEYEGSRITFEKNGAIMVNATEMAMVFNTKPANWLRTEQSERLIKAMAVSQKCDTADLVKVVQGGNLQGTWMHEDVALLFAQWLSPEFYIWCNAKIKELLITGKTILNNNLPDFTDPAEAAIAWANEYKAKKLAETKIIELQPKAEVYDKISHCDNLLTVSTVAKSLGTGQKRFFEWLRNNKILTKHNLPYQEYIDAGYFEVKATAVTQINRDYSQTYFTPKGQLWITEKYLNQTNKAA